MVHTPRHSGEPPAFTQRKPEWTARFQEIHAGSRTGDWATRNAKQLLRQHLYSLAYGECVYCESALDVTAELQIEHYHSKNCYPERAFEWTNLLPACTKCNVAKAEHDHEGSLLKPDLEHPEPFFWLHPDTGELQPHPTLDDADKQRALATIRLCNLQRPALCTQRADMLQRVSRWLSRLSLETAPSSMLRDEWNEFTDPRGQYKFVLRHKLRQAGLHLLAELDRQNFET
jgi:uncharacterized protein (TIGR02646 family)